MWWLGTQLSASTGNFELQSAFYVIADSGVGSNKLKLKKVTPKSGHIVVRWRKKDMSKVDSINYTGVSMPDICPAGKAKTRRK